MSLGSIAKKVGHITGKVAKYAAIPLALTGVGAPLAAGIGGLGGLLENATGDDASWKGALTSGATGAAMGLAGGGLRSGISALGGLGGGTGSASASGLGTKGGQSILSKILGGGKSLLSGIGGDSGLLGGLGKLGALGLGAYSLKQGSDQRGANQAFEQDKLNILKQGLGKAEAAYDEKAPLRKGGQDALLRGISQLQSMGAGPFADQYASLTSGRRKAGEYV